MPALSTPSAIAFGYAGDGSPIAGGPFFPGLTELTPVGVGVVYPPGAFTNTYGAPQGVARPGLTSVVLSPAQPYPYTTGQLWPIGL